MRNIKNFVILAVFFFLSCSDNDSISTLNETDLFTPETNVTYNNYNKISRTKLSGTWLLQNSTFHCELGKVDSLASYFYIKNTDKKMIINNTQIHKIHFWQSPYISDGVIFLDNTDSLNEFTHSPSGGAPMQIINLDFTNSSLTLIYPTSLKFYELKDICVGWITEEYKKSNLD